MPAATTKADLLAITGAEYAKLSALLADLEADVAVVKDADDTSIKDVVAHRAHWIDLFLGWYADGVSGREVHAPAPGYKWNELVRYNAELRASQRDLGWTEAMDQLADGHCRLLEFLDGLDEEALYGGPMPGASNDWTTGRWAESAGPSHYRSAAKYVRARLRALA